MDLMTLMGFQKEIMRVIQTAISTYSVMATAKPKAILMEILKD